MQFVGHWSINHDLPYNITKSKTQPCPQFSKNPHGEFMVANLAPSIEMTLLRKILISIRLAVRVPTSLG